MPGRFISKLPRLAIAAAAFLGFASWSAAQDAVTLDFPQVGAGTVLPVGLSDWPKETSLGLSSIEIPLLRLNEEGALLVTVVFQDDDGRIIQAKWKTAGSGQEVLLSNNLAEGVRGWNQRTLKVPFEQLSEAGSLVFETDAEAQPIKRVTLAWTWLAEVFMGTAAQNVEVIPDDHRILTRQDLSDIVAGAVPDAWAKGIWRAFLQESKESLDEALEFSFAMDAMPQAVVLRTKLLGVPLDATPEIWVNGQEVTPVSVQVPDLASGGYFKAPEGRLSYAGWREASVHIPASYFKAGDNSVVFGAQRSAYLKETFLELNFDEEGAPFNIQGESAPASAPATVTPTVTFPIGGSTSGTSEWPPVTAEPLESSPTVIVVPPTTSDANL